MARLIVLSFPRPANMWELTGQLLQDHGAECLVGYRFLHAGGRPACVRASSESSLGLASKRRLRARLGRERGISLLTHFLPSTWPWQAKACLSSMLWNAWTCGSRLDHMQVIEVWMDDQMRLCREMPSSS